MGMHSLRRAPRARAVWTSLALASGLGFAGCKGGGDGGGSNAQAAGGPSHRAGSQAAQAAGPAPLSASARAAFEEALHGFPADTRVALVAASPRTWLKLADYAGLRTRHAGLFGPVSAEVKRETGVDLLDPEVIQGQFGIDLDAPVSFGLLRIFEPRFVFSVRLTDSAKFTAAVTGMFAKAARLNLKPSPLDGGATWLPLGREGEGAEAGFLVTPTRAWLLVHEDRDDALLAFDARRIAAGKPGAGLAAEVDFKTAWEGLTGGAHLRGYVNVGQLLSSLTAEFSGAGRVARVREKVEARQAGLGSSADLPELQETLRRLETDRASQLAGGAAISLAVQSYAGGMSALGFGLDVGEKTLDLQVALRATEAALIQRLSADGPERPHPLLGLMVPDQTLALALALNPEGVLGLVRQVSMFTGGGAIEGVSRELKREVGLDLQTEIVPNLTGALALLLEVNAEDRKRRPQVSFTLALGVKDPVVAGPLVDRWAQHRAAEDDATKVDGRPTIGRGPDKEMMQLALVGDQVLISTRSAMFDGLAKGAETANAAAEKVRALWPTALHPHSALGQLHWKQLALADARRAIDWAAEVEPPERDRYTDAAKARALREEERALSAKQRTLELAAVEKLAAGVEGLYGRLDTRGERADLRLRQTFSVPVATVLDQLVAFELEDQARLRAYLDDSERIWKALRALEKDEPEKEDGGEQPDRYDPKAPLEADDGKGGDPEPDEGKEAYEGDSKDL